MLWRHIRQAGSSHGSDFGKTLFWENIHSEGAQVWYAADRSITKALVHDKLQVAQRFVTMKSFPIFRPLPAALMVVPQFHHSPSWNALHFHPAHFQCNESCLTTENKTKCLALSMMTRYGSSHSYLICVINIKMRGAMPNVLLNHNFINYWKGLLYCGSFG